MTITIRDNGKTSARWQVYDGNTKVSAHRKMSTAKKAAEAWSRKKKSTPKKRGRKASSKGHIRWKGNHPYIYQSVREGDVVRSRYWGTYEKWRQKHPTKTWVEFSTRCTMAQIDILDVIDKRSGGHVWKS